MKTFKVSWLEYHKMRVKAETDTEAFIKAGNERSQEETLCDRDDYSVVEVEEEKQ